MYPFDARPKNNTGIGVHDSPASWWCWGDVPYYINLLKSHKVSWYSLLGDNRDTAEFWKARNYMKPMLDADIMPILRLYEGQPVPHGNINRVALLPYVEASGGRPFFCRGTMNEVDMAEIEWNGDALAQLTSWNPDGSWRTDGVAQEEKRYGAVIDMILRQFAVMAEFPNVIPVLPDCLAIDERIWPQPGQSQEEDIHHVITYSKLFYYMDRKGVLKDILSKCAISIHPRNHLGRPNDYPYDQAVPRQHSRSYCFNAHEALHETVMRVYGKPVLMLATEAGPEPDWVGRNPDGSARYGPLSLTNHKNIVVELTSWLKLGKIPNYLDGLCLWTIREDRSTSPFAKAAYWNNVIYNKNLPAWDALEQLAPWIRTVSGTPPAGPWVDVRKDMPTRADVPMYPTAPPVSRLGIVMHWADDTGKDYTPLEIAKYQTSPNAHLAFPQIAYHFMVRQDGTLFYTLDLAAIPWHVGPDNAKYFSVLAQPPRGTMWTDAQITTLQKLISNLYDTLSKEPVIKLHKQLAATQCPGPLGDQLLIALISMPDQSAQVRALLEQATANIRSAINLL